MQKITITLTRYAEPNWLLLETLSSLVEQEQVIATVLMLDQKNDQEIIDFCQQNSTPNIQLLYQTIPAKSLSFARNEAIRMCETAILLYIDTDAIATPNWAYELSEGMHKQDAAVGGGKIIAKWHCKPGFLQKSPLVLEQYSMLDLGDDDLEVKKIIGANFGLNIHKLEKLACFDENLGRKNGKLLGGEETSLCAAAIKAGYRVFYFGKSKVYHQVLPERINFKWICKRMYYGGYSRALQGGMPSPNNKTKQWNKWDVFALCCLLPTYVLGFVFAKLDRNNKL
jgi:glycosyltransferase involved in cell wall biosynthesis